MRQLQNTDIFAIGRIITKANLREELKEIATAESTNLDNLEAVGFDILFALFTSCSDKEVENEIYDLLSSLFELSVEEVKAMNPLETMEKIKQVADWKEWKTFFLSAAKLKK